MISDRILTLEEREGDIMYGGSDLIGGTQWRGHGGINLLLFGIRKGRGIETTERGILFLELGYTT